MSLLTEWLASAQTTRCINSRPARAVPLQEKQTYPPTFSFIKNLRILALNGVNFVLLY
jgi:hypothetical protein